MDIKPRLILSDLDGTLLNSKGELPAGFWETVDRLHDEGILFCPASGRAYSSLEYMFKPRMDVMPIIAENGAYVLYQGEELYSLCLEPEFVSETVLYLRELSERGVQLDAIISGKDMAYLESADENFRPDMVKYYHSHALGVDMLAHPDGILKIAIHADDARAFAEEYLTEQAKTHNVVVSGKYWVDIMCKGVSKAMGVARLQEFLGISREETIAFGDYFNDLEMFEQAGMAIAVSSGHPEVISRADRIAPSHEEAGVLRALEELGL